MDSYVVLGAGPVGRETARLLANEGHRVALVSRAGAGSDIPGVRAIAADAADATGLAKISEGTKAIVMCAMAAYHRWPTDFFPIVDGAVTAAEMSGARFVMLGNLYGYGESATMPLTPGATLDPTTRKGAVRTIIWQRALRAKAPAIEVRASDYLGRDAIAYFSLLALPALREGRTIAFPGDPDATHAWSFTKDVARTLVAATRYAGGWNRPFHAPSLHVSVRELVEAFAHALGVPPPALRPISAAELIAIGFNEAVEMNYMFEKPFLVDAKETEELLGVRASNMDEMIRDTLSNSP
jgi:nucleoside-diphosphate-sugar epimerase